MCAASVDSRDDEPEPTDLWYDYEDLPSHQIGLAVSKWTGHPFATPNADAVADELSAFFADAGITAVRAVGKGVGSATLGAIVVPILPKLVGPTIQVVTHASKWLGRLARIQRREQLPNVLITILADHLAPQYGGRNATFDSARMLCTCLPDLQARMKDAFPALRFSVTIRARTIHSAVQIQFGDLPVTDRNVVKMYDLLQQEGPITIMHTRGWFALPAVAKGRYLAPREVIARTHRGMGGTL